MPCRGVQQTHSMSTPLVWWPSLHLTEWSPSASGQSLCLRVRPEHTRVNLRTSTIVTHHITNNWLKDMNWIEFSYFLFAMIFMFALSEVACLLESSSKLIRTLEQVNLSLREGKNLDISLATVEAIIRLKDQLNSLLQGRKWRNAVDRIWAFGPRRLAYSNSHNKKSIEENRRTLYGHICLRGKSQMSTYRECFFFLFLSESSSACLVHAAVFNLKLWGHFADGFYQSYYVFRCGPNILLNSVDDYERPSLWECLSRSNGVREAKAQATALRDFDNSIVSGFQLATLSGPMCEEPLMGVCFSIERWDIQSSVPPQNVDSLEVDSLRQPDLGVSETSTQAAVPSQARPRAEAASADCYGPVSGQLIAAMKEACRHAFQAHPQRLMAAMYTCEIMSTAEVLGKNTLLTNFCCFFLHPVQIYYCTWIGEGNIWEMNIYLCMVDECSTFPVAVGFFVMWILLGAQDYHMLPGCSSLSHKWWLIWLVLICFGVLYLSLVQVECMVYWGSERAVFSMKRWRKEQTCSSSRLFCLWLRALDLLTRSARGPVGWPVHSWSSATGRW